MTNVQIAAMLASLQQQMAAIAAATLPPPPPVVQSQAARDWLPNIAVVVGDLDVVDVFNNRDDAFAARASLAKLDASSIYRVLPECRDDSGVACSVVVVRAREAVAA